MPTGPVHRSARAYACRLRSPASISASAISATGSARRHFDGFPPGAKKQILYWIKTAKKPETRAKRIAETVRLAARNERARA